MLDAHRASARTRNRRIAATAALVAALGVHVALAAYFVDFKLVFAHAPIGGDDYNTHYAQTWRVIEGLRHWGRTWVYDVKLLAGQPEGTIFDADNKGWSLWTYALVRAGVSQPVAFNLFVAFVMLSVSPALFGAARLFGFGFGGSVTAALLGSMLWYFDSFVHWAWWIGMVSYAFAAYFALIPLGLFYRFEQTRKLGYALLCAPVLGLAHLIHPYTFFILALPMAVLYARSFRSFTRREHAAIVAIAVVTFAINARWLLDALHHWHYILNSAFFAQARLSYLATDYLGLLRDPADTGMIGTHTGFRFLCLGFAACGLWRLRSERDPRFAPLAAAIGTLFVLAYFGALVPGAAQVQPYRHIIPLCFMLTLPAGYFVAQWATRDAARQASGPTRAVLVVAALIAVQHLLSDALYFMPTLLPKPATMADETDPPLSVYGFPNLLPRTPGFLYRLPGLAALQQNIEEVEDWLVPRVAPGERVLVDDPAFGERMAWRMPFEIIGGFRQRNLAHSYANLFRDEHKQWSPNALADYLRTFAISWVITYIPRKDFEAAREVLRPMAVVHGFRIYRTRFPVSKVVGGSGNVRARTNRIEVRASDPNAPLLLSYHYHPSLRCKPNCRVERGAVALDRVGLIKVPAPHPADLVIWNSYQ